MSKMDPVQVICLPQTHRFRLRKYINYYTRGYLRKKNEMKKEKGLVCWFAYNIESGYGVARATPTRPSLPTAPVQPPPFLLPRLRILLVDGSRLS